MTRELRAKDFPFLLILTVALAGSAGGVAIKYAVLTIPPFTFAAMRFTLSSAALVSILLRREGRISLPSARGFGICSCAALNSILFVIGIPYTGAVVSQALYVFTPILVSILSYLLLGEAVSRRKVLGIFIGLAGALGIVFEPVLTGEQISGGALYGNLLVLGAVVFYSLYTAGAKQLQREYSSLSIVTLYALIVFGASWLLAVPELLEIAAWWHGLDAGSLIALIVSSLIGTVFYYFLYQYLIFLTSPVKVAVSLYLQPVMTYFLAFSFFHEEMTLSLIIATVLTIFGAYVVVSDT